MAAAAAWGERRGLGRGGGEGARGRRGGAPSSTEQRGVAGAERPRPWPWRELGRAGRSARIGPGGSGAGPTRPGAVGSAVGGEVARYGPSDPRSDGLDQKGG